MNNGIYFGANRTAIIDMEAVNSNLPARPMRDKPITDDQYKIMPWAIWGDDNLKPQKMADDIEKCGGLQGIVTLKSRLAACEGLVPAIIKGSEEGTRVIDKIIDDEEINEFLDASNHFVQTAAWTKDLVGMGNAECRWMANKAGDKIVAFKRDDISEMRFEKKQADGYIRNVFHSSEWNRVISPNDNRVYKLPLLKEWAPWLDAAELMAGGVKEFVSAFRYPAWGKHYYSTPHWYSAYKWVKYVQAVPEVKAAEMDNMMRPAFIVTIYEGFWNAQFEDWGNITDPKEKEARKTALFADIDNKLMGKSNAGKNIYVAGALSMEFGKAQPFIEFKAMERPEVDGSMLPDAAAGNSEIAFAEMMNLALIGGNQSAGPYTKNEGGSNIREASLFQIVITELERRYIRSLMNVPKYVNRWNKRYPGLEFIIPATALTTLDTGAGSKPVNTGGLQNKDNGTTNNNSGGKGNTPPAAE